ncbi:MAG: hypothetical protein KDJ39_06015 [Gammaproteobacteria bacterium]|nr:hypothetical protein [Gammaproteobacteria bacterium]
MSNFSCNHCGNPCIDSRIGYVTGCEHYPADVVIAHCKECGHEIAAGDDPRLLCTACGGRNRRVAYD